MTTFTGSPLLGITPPDSVKAPVARTHVAANRDPELFRQALQRESIARQHLDQQRLDQQRLNQQAQHDAEARKPPTATHDSKQTSAVEPTTAALSPANTQETSQQKGSESDFKNASDQKSSVAKKPQASVSTEGTDAKLSPDSIPSLNKPLTDETVAIAIAGPLLEEGTPTDNLPGSPDLTAAGLALIPLLGLAPQGPEPEVITDIPILYEQKSPVTVMENPQQLPEEIEAVSALSQSPLNAKPAADAPAPIAVTQQVAAAVKSALQALHDGGVSSEPNQSLTEEVSPAVAGTTPKNTAVESHLAALAPLFTAHKAQEDATSSPIAKMETDVVNVSSTGPQTGEVSKATLPGALPMANPTLVPNNEKITLPMNIAFGHSQWTEGLAERTGWLVDRKIEHAEIALDPPELGPIAVKIHLQNDQASISFVAHNPAVKDAMDQSMPRLRELLQEQGIVLSHSDVSSQQRQSQGREAATASGLLGEDSDDALTEVTLRLPSKHQIDYFA